MPSPLPTFTAVARRYLVLIAAVLLASSTLTLIAAAPAQAVVNKPIDGITYSADPAAIGAGATVTGYDGAQGSDVVIPDIVDIGGTDYAVTAIGEDAFSDNGLTSVALPAGLITIGTSAFTGNKLTSVNLPKGLTTIRREAFQANQLTSVNFPDTLTTLESHSFLGNQLTSVTLPGGITTVGTQTFAYNDLSTVTLPQSLTRIGGDAFYSNQLKSVILPPALTSIDMSAFGDNEELTQVRLTGPAPTTITEAGNEYSSLGTADGLNVEIPARYLERDGQPGYNTPTWRGYSTVAVPGVLFNTHGSAVVEPVTVWPGEVFELPSAPVREGYTFTGWYTTPELETLFDPDAPLSGDVTLHAGWTPVSVPATPLTPASGSLSGGSIDDYLPAGYGS